MSKDRLLNAIHDTRDCLRNATQDLHSVADALSRVGLDRLAMEIEEVAAPFDTLSKNLLNAWHHNIDGQMAHSQEMMGGILKLVLDGRVT